MGIEEQVGEFLRLLSLAQEALERGDQESTARALTRAQDELESLKGIGSLAELISQYDSMLAALRGAL